MGYQLLLSSSNNKAYKILNHLLWCPCGVGGGGDGMVVFVR